MGCVCFQFGYLDIFGSMTETTGFGPGHPAMLIFSIWCHLWMAGKFWVSWRFFSGKSSNFRFLGDFPAMFDHRMVPSGNLTVAMERSTIFDGKIHYKWPFSIAMLVYQRVTGW